MEPTGLALVLGVALLALATLAAGPGLVVRFRDPDAALGFGPMFRAEWVRLCRRGTHLRFRVAYALFLLYFLFHSYQQSFLTVGLIDLLLEPGEFVEPRRLAFMAEAFVQNVLLFQLVAVSIVTPVFAEAAVLEERDRNTLDVLRSSLLTDRELVVGKLAARVLFLLGVAATGLPVLLFATLFGGVAADTVVVGFVVLTFQTTTLAAFSMLFATWNQERPRWFFVSFFVVVAFSTIAVGVACFVFDLPFFTRWLTGTETRLLGPAVMVGFVALSTAATLLFAGLAGRGLRNVTAWRPAESNEERERTIQVLPMGDDPLAWKDQCFTTKTFWHSQPSVPRLLKVGTGLGAAVAVLTLALFVFDWPINDLIRPLFCGASLIVVVLCVFSGTIAATSVTVERQKRTLEILLSLPHDRIEFLLAKWRAVALFLRPFELLYVPPVLTVTVALVVHPVAAAAAAAMVFAIRRFQLTLGLWLSVRCRSTARAIVWHLVLTLAVFATPWVLSDAAGRAVRAVGGPADVVPYMAASCTPFGLVLATQPWDGPYGRVGPRRFNYGFAAMAGTAAVYLLLSAWLWRDAVRTFEREGRT